MRKNKKNIRVNLYSLLEDPNYASYLDVDYEVSTNNCKCDDYCRCGVVSVKAKKFNKDLFIKSLISKVDDIDLKYGIDRLSNYANISGDNFHREGGPARKFSDGSIFYYQNGILHRKDGPAIEMSDGNKEWYLNGLRHREDGPAIEYPYRRKEWFIDGKRHRKDGPAVEWFDGDKEWWLKGEYYGDNSIFTNESWIKFVKTLIFL